MGLVIYAYLPTFALEINHKCLNIRHTLMVWVWLEDDLCLFSDSCGDVRWLGTGLYYKPFFGAGVFFRLQHTLKNHLKLALNFIQVGICEVIPYQLQVVFW